MTFDCAVAARGISVFISGIASVLVAHAYGEINGLFDPTNDVEGKKRAASDSP